MNPANVISSVSSLDPVLARLVDDLTAKLQRREPVDQRQPMSVGANETFS